MLSIKYTVKRYITHSKVFFLAKVGNLSWWITGGLSKDGSTDSTEIFNEALSSPNKMEDGPNLPFKIYGHCMLTLPNDGVRKVRLCLCASRFQCLSNFSRIPVKF